MTLPSGQITFSDLNVELGRSAIATISLNDTQLRQLSGDLSGAIQMANLRGKTWAFSFNDSVGGGQVNVRSSAVARGWNQYGPVVCTINSNSWSNSSGTPTILITGNFPTGLTLVINPGVYVVGKGGDGGGGGGGGGGGSGTGGGPAISVTGYSGGQLIFINNGVIAGGGGGGGGGGYYTTGDKYGTYYYGGGGGGGGAGFGSGGPGGSAANGNGNGGGGGDLVNPGGGGAGSSSAGGGGSGGGLGSSGASGGSSSAGGGSGAGPGAAATGTVAAGVIWSVVGTRYGSVN